MFLSKSAPVEVSQAGPDTHVLLRDKDQRTLGILVFADSAVSKLPNRITLEMVVCDMASLSVLFEHGGEQTTAPAATIQLAVAGPG